MRVLGAATNPLDPRAVVATHALRGQAAAISPAMLLVCRMGARCFWDDNTDSYAQEVFQNVRHSARHLAHAAAQQGSVAQVSA